MPSCAWSNKLMGRWGDTQSLSNCNEPAIESSILTLIYNKVIDLLLHQSYIPHNIESYYIISLIIVVIYVLSSPHYHITSPVIQLKWLLRRRRRPRGRVMIIPPSRVKKHRKPTISMSIHRAQPRWLKAQQLHSRVAMVSLLLFPYRDRNTVAIFWCCSSVSCSICWFNVQRIYRWCRW